MKIDLTLRVSTTMRQIASENEKIASLGHMGTHFDVMDSEFPLDYAIRCGRMIDVTGVRSRDITIEDLKGMDVFPGDFVMFRTGFIEEFPYGSKEYFTEHPQLSFGLIDYLLEKGVSMIGVDAAGVRRSKEHTPTDQYCADRGVFIVENLVNLDKLFDCAGTKPFTVYTFPINFEGMTGLPCRVIAQIG